MRSTFWNLRTLGFALAAITCVMAASSVRAAFPPSALADVRDETARLAGLPSRVVGTPGHEEAVRHLLEELRGLDGVRVWVHRFPVVMPRVRRAELTVPDGPHAGSHRIYPLWPASVRLNTTPAGGISGRLVYIGRAEEDRVPPRSLRDQIAVMELSGGEGWRTAAEAGATAILLLDDGHVTQADAATHFLPLPVNTPRFYVAPGALADALRRGEVAAGRVDSSCVWEEVEATSIYALVSARRGSPARRALAIATPIDSASVVPELAPGADSAVDTATAMTALRHFAENRPAAPLLFAFLDAATISQLGMREMLGALTVPPRGRSSAIEKDIENLDTYRLAADLASELTARGDALSQLNESRYRDLHRYVRDEADEDVVAVETDLQALRLESPRAEGERLAEITRRIKTLTARRNHLRAAQESLVTAREVTERLRPTATELWRRAHARIMEQHDQATRTVAAVDQGRTLRQEILDALGGPAAVGYDSPVSFVLGLDLSDAGVAAGPSRFCFFQTMDETGNSRDLREWILRAIKRKKDPIWDADTRHAVNLEPYTGLSVHNSCIVGRLATLTSPAVSLGVSGATWTTLGAARPRVDTPTDFAERLDWSRLEPQVRATFQLLDALANDAEFARDTTAPPPKWCRVTGVVVDSAPGEPVARLPMSGYVATLVTGKCAVDQCTPLHTAPTPGLRRQEFRLTGADGRFRFDLLTARMPTWSNLQHVYLQAYNVAGDGSITRAIDYRRMGRGSTLNFDLATGTKTDSLRAVPFSCREISAFGLVDSRFLMPLESGSLLDARSFGEPKRSNVSFFGGMMASQIEPDASWLVVLRAGITRNRMVLLNLADPAADPEVSVRELARGFDAEAPLSANSAYLGARDWYRLDGRRLRDYSKAGITSQAIDLIRDRTAELLREADEAQTADDALAFRRSAGAAMANESAAYKAVLDTADDTIRGAIFLLLVLVPFAYVMERLLVASPSIYRQILWTMGIFAVMTAVLWSFHPAFRISSQPLTIIMAFGIICLAGLVISMVYNKFSIELEKMRSGRAEESGARTSRLGVLTTAIRLGIANMRKRKLRTALTGLTVVLITFALLCFVSTSKYTDYREYSLDQDARFTGVLLRNAGARPMPENALQTVQMAVTPGRQVVPRYWWAHGQIQWRLFARNQANGEEADFAGALGLTPEESSLTAIAQVCPDWDRFARDGGCYMSAERAAKLQVKPGDKVILAGQPLELIGIFDPGRFDHTVYDLDGRPLTPADYTALSQFELTDISRTNLARLAHEEITGASFEEDRALPYLSSAMSIIVRAEMLRDHVETSQLRSIVIPARTAEGAREAARQLADRFALLVTYGVEGRTAAVLARAPLVPSAPRSLLIPLLVGGLIIFNTMLSSIAERRREVYVYTSLGLAPIHVGFLFLAEALTYGLMGAVFGYVVGQAVATLFSHLGWLGDITLNYSGMQAIMIMAMVMAVVMVSSLVPAYLAGRLAAPSNVRSWDVPEPKDDMIHDVLPFTVTPATACGVAAFLHDFLDAHREGVMGDFSTDDLRALPSSAGGCAAFTIQATVWLAPYDLGVRQEVSLSAEPAAHEEVYEIHVRIRREAGSEGTWHKLNRSFLGTLRRQLLGWRKLTSQRVMAYMAQGEILLASLGGEVTAGAVQAAGNAKDSDGMEAS